MQLWLVRHAIAADRAPDVDGDWARPLTSRGREEFRRLARWLARHVPYPDTVISSPLVRALETAEILSKELGRKKKDVVVSPVMSPGVDVEQLARLCAEHPAESMAVVGHEPDMSRLTSLLLGGAAVDFEKGAVACLEFEGSVAAGRGRLRWFMTPWTRPAESE